ALAVGDCCLMHVDDVGKGMRAIETFPLQRSSQFTMSPYLIGSRSDDESLKDRIQVSKGSLRDGDMLLLATDAMAAWLLNRHAQAGHRRQRRGRQGQRTGRALDSQEDLGNSLLPASDQRPCRTL